MEGVLFLLREEGLGTARLFPLPMAMLTFDGIRCRQADHGFELCKSSLASSTCGESAVQISKIQKFFSIPLTNSANVCIMVAVSGG